MTPRYTIQDGPSFIALLLDLGQCDPKYRKPLYFQIIPSDNGFLKRVSFLLDSLTRLEDGSFIIGGRMDSEEIGVLTTFSAHYSPFGRRGFFIDEESS